MEHLPIYLPVFFGLVVAATIAWFYYATTSKLYLWVALGWLVVQSIFAISGLYQNTESLPPRLMLFGILPALIMVVLFMYQTKNTPFIRLQQLTWFHFIRVPVEIVLLLLYRQQVMSVYITYEGTNFDIISGITAPVIAIWAYRNGTRTKLLLWWNIICLLLLLNVVVTALLAFPSPLQRLAFDQPNMAVMHFPYNLLPVLIVPTVLLAHFIAIRQLLKNGRPNA